jgi:hypothetical protein
MDKRDVILKLQNKSCYSCKWHREFRWERGEPLPLPIHKCHLGKEWSDLPNIEICTNYQKVDIIPKTLFGFSEP